MTDWTDPLSARGESTMTLVEGPAPTPRALSDELTVGATLGRYLVLEKLGAGGMGIVTRAYDPRLRREVAVKRLRPDTHGDQEELLHEARAMAQLSHPNVMAVHDVEQTERGVIIAMELAPGVTLRKWWAEDRTWAQIVDVFVKAGRGLQAAHDAGLVHRDFKPGNVLVDEDGRVRVTDFGLARIQDDLVLGDTSPSDDDHPAESPAPPRKATVVFGTPAYMAPEQHEGAVTDARTDQYAFCLTLWEALCGSRPFGGSSFKGLHEQKLEGPPPWPRSADVPAWLASLVRRGLHPDPRERWPSMDALLEVLERRPERRRRRRVRLALGGLVLLGGGIGLGSWNAREPGCMQGRERIDAVWSDEQRQAVEARLAAGRPYIAATRPAVVQGLDDYATRWARLHDDACAAHDRKEQSSYVLDLRMLCLDRRRVSMATVIGLLADPQADVVDRTLRMVSELPRLERCADVQSLLSQVPPPEDPTVAATVEDIRQQLAELQALFSAGLFARFGERIEPLAERARATGYTPVMAEVEVERALFQTSAGRYLAAHEHYRQAYTLAIGADHDEAAAQAAIALVYILGIRLARYDEAEVWSDTALALAERLDPAGLLHARALEHLGGLMTWTGRHVEAEAHLERALALAETRFGPISAPVATAALNLASLADFTGDSERTLALIERSVAINTERLGPEHPTTTGARANLANALRRAGRHDQAQALFEEVLVVQRRTLRIDHPTLGFTLMNMAAVAMEQGRFDDGRRLGQEAVAIHEANLGPEHPDLADAIITLGGVLQEQGDYVGARRHFERAIEIRKRALGPDHSEVARAEGELGLALWRLGEYERAESLLRRSLSATERRFGPDHPDATLTVNNLASLLMEQERPAEAEPLFRRAAATWESVRGPDDPDVAMALSNLGGALRDLNRLDEATAVLERALSIRERVLGPGHPRLAYTLSALGDVRSERGEHEEARRFYRRSLEIRQDALGPEHPLNATPLRLLAESYHRQAQLESAEQSYRRALEILEPSLGPAHPETADTRVELARVLLDRRRRAEAIAVLERSIAALSSAPLPRHLAEARFDLAQILWTSAPDRARATELAREAAAGFTEADEAESLAEVERWLDRHPR